MLPTPMAADAPLLVIEALNIAFAIDDGDWIEAVRRVDLRIDAGRTTCLVGESGCGKSVTARAVLRLLDPAAVIRGGRILFRGEQAQVSDIAALDPYSRAMRQIRGNQIAMIFQEPMSSLSPVHTIGAQISEMIVLHENLGSKAARARTIELLRDVDIPNPGERVDAYPFELSGGLRQRAMIAMALACRPSLLIADEPTTALDVTTQAQILDLLLRLREENDMAMLFITHDLGVVAEVADRVAIMYLGEIVEEADVFDLFEAPRHPYTRALLDSIPKVVPRAMRPTLQPIRGVVPSPQARPAGCAFHTRCDHVVQGLCAAIEPDAIPVAADHPVRCHLVDPSRPTAGSAR
ncbi:ABC transporter ATP-binding protein [Marinivivus vitaminiproducens]|uniref:ABC transporter ATP-binding protein n=1 Tax=Marinivivus vitaminiproducens TaxID=3035935 RepID=UPI0027A7D54F|nr:ABC transporter ATP-binding protein [Geminicoccaceae bacterium SCSIO 64248]